MRHSREILFALIRSALGEGADSSNVISLSGFVADDWQKVINLSFDQGIAAIAVDGLQKIVELNPEPELTIDSNELENLRYEWFGSVLQAECDFANYLSAAKALARFYVGNDIKTLVLKGLVLSECYPIPSHRSSCDLDCYLENDYEKGNLLVEHSGVTVDRAYFKNSSFNYKGLHVENHHYFTAFRGSRKAKAYERLLQQEITLGETRPIFDSDLLAPPVMFSALFCISHAQTHFLTEGIILRHILDWALFRIRHFDEIDWSRFESVCREYGMWQFAQTITRIGLFLIGETEYSSLTALDLRLLDDTMSYSKEKKYNGMRRRGQLVLKSFQAGWKYKNFSDQNVLEHVVQRVVGYFERGNDALLGDSVKGHPLHKFQ